MSKKPFLVALCASTLAAGPTQAQNLYWNAPLHSGPLSKSFVAAPAGTNWSECQNNIGNFAESNTLAGSSGALSGIPTDFRLADDFTIPAGQTWTITGVAVFPYQTGAPATPSPIASGTLRIWDTMAGDPTMFQNVVFGDTTTNRLLAGGSTDALVFRIFNTMWPPPTTATATNRRVWRTVLTVSPALVLGPGTYWIDFQTRATNFGNHFHPLNTIPGSRTRAGANARQSLNGGTSFAAIIDDGFPAAAPNENMDLPFLVIGTSAAPQPTGACCTNAACTIATAADCGVAHGIYQGDGTDCATPCVAGSCCLGNGTCQVFSTANCGALAGTYNGNGTDCTTNPCTAPSGACCTGALVGSCNVLTVDFCTTVAGAYRGNGTTCTPNPCVGACCRTDGSCVTTTVANCALQPGIPVVGGTYSGDGTVCTTANICPVGGACCATDGSGTCRILTNAACTAADPAATWSGANTNCVTTTGAVTYAVTTTDRLLEDIFLTGTPLGTPDSGNLDDGSFEVNFEPGFVIHYFDRTYGRIRISTNGYTTFSTVPTNGNVAGNPATLPGTAVPNDTIAAYFEDLDLTNSGTLSIETRGTAPNRRFIIQWTNVPNFGCADANTFQAILYEGSGIIEFRYGTVAAQGTLVCVDTGGANVNASFVVGIENRLGTVGNNIAPASIGTGNTARMLTPRGDYLCTQASGACCMPDGSCSQMEAINCQTAGGTYMGTGVDCTAVAPCRRGGDVNCDGSKDGIDITAFTVALLDSVNYPAQFPGCNINNADFTNNQMVTSADVPFMVACLLSGNCP